MAQAPRPPLVTFALVPLPCAAMTEPIPVLRRAVAASLLVALAALLGCRSNPVMPAERESFGQFTEVAAANFDERYNSLFEGILTRLAELEVEESPRETIEIEGVEPPGDIELQILLAQELNVGGEGLPVPIQDGDVMQFGQSSRQIVLTMKKKQ